MKLLLVALLLASAATTACQTTESNPDSQAKATEKTAEKVAKKTADKADPDKPAGAPSSEAAQTTADQKTGHFGAAFTMDTSQPLAAVLEKANDHVGKTIKVTGKVNTVCKKKGCWMVLQPEGDASTTVRITMKDYGFFVPKDCDGQSAIVEGVFNEKDLSEARRKHLAEDQGKDPSKVTGETKEWTIVANGITIGG